MGETTKQCKAGVILYYSMYDVVERELRCQLNEGHDGYHVDSHTGWSADG